MLLRTPLLCLTLTAALWAQGGFSGPGRYEIANVKSGKVVDMDRNDRTTVIQFSSRGTDNQVWEIEPARGGYFYIRNAMNGNALEASQNRNSAPLQARRFEGGPNQQWRIEPGKDGNALIVSRLGKCIDVPDGTGRDGVALQVYDPNGDSNQRFTFRRAGGRGRMAQEQRAPASFTLRCSSDDGRRNFCPAETARGVRLVRQLSGSPCREGVTWGYDRRAIWVDRGCRAEFELVGRR